MGNPVNTCTSATAFSIEESFIDSTKYTIGVRAVMGKKRSPEVETYFTVPATPGPEILSWSTIEADTRFFLSWKTNAPEQSKNTGELVIYLDDQVIGPLLVNDSDFEKDILTEMHPAGLIFQSQN